MKLKTLLFLILIIFLGFILIQSNSNNSNNKKGEIIIEKDYINNKNNNSGEINKIYVDKTENAEKITENKDIGQNKIKEEVKFKCPTPTKEYNDMSLSNIDQDNSLTDITYVPSNLKELDLTYATREHLCLTEEAKNAFEEMMTNAKKEEIKIKISSAFRSYNYQAILFNNSEKDKNGNSLSTAKPGYSEHQLGTTIDITGSTINYLTASDSFGGTKEDIWLLNNAHLYGFVQSYPYKKEDITGYKYEPWHYRYIGKEKATELKNLDITLKEYLAK